MRLAYIVSRYPYVSHVFIQREVLALRRAGAEVDTFTIRRPDPGDLRSADDRAEQRTTHAILPARLSDLVRAHLGALLTRPRRYLSTLALAASLRGAGARAALWQLFYFGEAALLWRECRRRGIRHIHAHHANVASDVALLASHLGGGGWSWSFTMHGSTEFFDVGAHRLGPKTALAGFVVCVSEHGRSQLMTHVDPTHWDKLRVVHCGVDPDRFALVDRTDRDGEPEILTIGRLVPVKGQKLLIEAVAKLVQAGQPASLSIVGDGPEEPALRARARELGIADRVRFVGAVGQEEVAAWYARADLFALPSFAEGIPVVLMEAMATGLPVVASRITGIPELVDDGVSGKLVTPGRGDHLAATLASVLALAPQRRGELGREARAKIVSEFTLNRNVERLLAVFTELIPGSHWTTKTQIGSFARLRRASGSRDANG